MDEFKQFFEEGTGSNVAPANAPVSVQNNAPASTAPQAMSDISFSVSTEQENEFRDFGVEPVSIGTAISTYPIDKYKVSETKKDRISIIVNTAFPIAYHYFDGIGYVRCFNGKCCELSEKKQIKYLFPIVVYNTDSEGEITSPKITLKVLPLDLATYNVVSEIHKHSPKGISYVDLLVSCTDTKWKKMQLISVGEALWRKYPAMVAYVKDTWEKYGGKITLPICKNLTEEEFTNLYNSKMKESLDNDPFQSYSPKANMDELFK